ncbi:1050_t:CDS:2 [Cetraspora pellucida]|uniref:1050_t:CDS:1 n=1 Tax=Cetraspora pellucida TaxID=1433469 RepID=A0ACA9MGN3_9GLOM|nr:1050_t:CDS:2 [Cetraspora pellucida]
MILTGLIRQKNLRDRLAASCQKDKYVSEQSPRKIQKIINEVQEQNSNPIISISYNITEVDDEIDVRSIASNKNYSPKYNNITPSFDTDSYEVNSDDNVYKLPNIASHTIKPSKSLRILSKQLATSSKAIEIDNSETNSDNDKSELPTIITSCTMRSLKFLKTSTQLLVSTSNAIEADSSEVNNDNNSSELSTSNKIRSLKSSRCST